jgi:hypothetical protein
MTMSVCRSIQYETQQMGNVQRVATDPFSFGNNEIDFVYFYISVFFKPPA